MAIDSLYVKKTALHKLVDVQAYAHKKTEDTYIDCLFGLEHLPPVAPVQWHDKGETLYMTRDQAAYLPKSKHWQQAKESPGSTVSRYDNPLATHQLSYLNGGGGNGKTMRATEFFRVRDPVVFYPTNRLAKEMRKRGVKAQIYHSFFRWNGQNDWTLESMGQQYIPRVIIWDEVCTAPRPTLETLLDWLSQRGVQVVRCGDQG